MDNFTPGPWKVNHYRHARGEQWLGILQGAWDVTHNKEPWEIANCKYSAMSDAENLANAYLMAAAPDLLSACLSARAALGYIRSEDEQQDVDSEIEELDAAIAKAKGATNEQ